MRSEVAFETAMHLPKIDTIQLMPMVGSPLRISLETSRSARSLAGREVGNCLSLISFETIIDILLQCMSPVHMCGSPR